MIKYIYREKSKIYHVMMSNIDAFCNTMYLNETKADTPPIDKRLCANCRTVIRSRIRATIPSVLRCFEDKYLSHSVEIVKYKKNNLRRSAAPVTLTISHLGEIHQIDLDPGITEVYVNSVSFPSNKIYISKLRLSEYILKEILKVIRPTEKQVAAWQIELEEGLF